MVRIAVFASGRGSNFRAVDQALRGVDSPPAEIVLCVSNNPSPGAFEYASGHGIPTVRLSPKMFPDEPETYSARLEGLLTEYSVDLILLTGYMRKLPGSVVERFRGRILNIHPALLPDFGGKGMYGIHVHTAVIDAGRRESGATVHLADEEYDTGAIIAQESVSVEKGDTPETLAARVLEVEHRLLPRVVFAAAEAIASNRPITEISIPDEIPGHPSV